MMSSCRRALRRSLAAVFGAALLTGAAHSAPKVVVISLDGATPRLADQYLAGSHEGVDLLQSVGAHALQNLTITPSLTAPGHIAIATGSVAARNDINANTFHLVASPFARTISGFNAPIGGYSIDGPAETASPTAEPLWLSLRAAGKSVATATWPGGDGVDVTVPGLSNSPVVQSAAKRTVDYTVPFGTFAGGASKFNGKPVDTATGTGFTLTAADFSPAPQALVSQLTAAGRTFYGPVLVKTNVETFTISDAGTLKAYQIDVVALDTTNDGQTNYDTLVFFDHALGIQPGPFALPSTGPAYVKSSDHQSSPFFLEGSTIQANTAFYITQLAPDLSTVHFVRYSANYIPRNAPVIADVDDINTHVGAWGDQSDYRFTERLAPGTANFSDAELEAIFEDQVRNFLDYQTRVALRAIDRNPDVDLLMVYLEQPDGSEHQFLLIDPRQATDPTNPATVGAGQDSAKIARYQGYVRFAYQQTNHSVQRILDRVGAGANGRPNSDVLVVSDHGFEAFHTAVNLNALFAANGIDTTKVKAITSGPAANVYISVAGREPNGLVTSNAEYQQLQQKVVALLQSLQDTNPNYTNGAASVPVFDKVFVRPSGPNDAKIGRRTSAFIGQDSGDVFALLTPGYNFDGVQGTGVVRLGDPAATSPVLSVPNFYGAHGYDPNLPHMSAIFYAAGPDVQPGLTLTQVRNIDIAPTVDRLLGVTPAPTVQGRAISLTSAPLTLIGASSRKAQGAAGVYDLPLALTGPATVEARQGDANDGRTLTLTFSNNVTAATASVVHGSGQTGAPSLQGSSVVIPLSGVTDRQTLTVRLTDVTDVFGNTLPSVDVTVAYLLGDVNGTGAVNVSDVALVKAQTADGVVNDATYRDDLNGDGLIDAADVALAKSASGHKLP